MGKEKEMDQVKIGIKMEMEVDIETRWSTGVEMKIDHGDGGK